MGGEVFIIKLVFSDPQKHLGQQLPPRGHIPHPLSRIKLMCLVVLMGIPSLEGFFFSFSKREDWMILQSLQCRHRMGIMALKRWLQLGVPFVDTNDCHHDFGKVSYVPFTHSVTLALSVVEWNGRLIRDIGRNTVKRIFALFTSEQKCNS